MSVSILGLMESVFRVPYIPIYVDIVSVSILGLMESVFRVPLVVDNILIIKFQSLV